jgi:Skp family chaperone for outer membrane proteins
MDNPTFIMRPIMSRQTILSTLIFLLAATSSQTLAAPAGGVAVLDLDKIATAMGWTEEMKTSIEATSTELKGQLEGVHRGMLQSIDNAKKQIATEAKLTEDQTKVLANAKDQRELDGLPLSKEQRQKLVETADKANASWQTALNNYQQALQGRRANLVQGYRERIRPAARRVAAVHGMTVVLATSDNLIYFEQSADITDQVIDELQKTLPEKKPTSPSSEAPASSSGAGP